MNWYSVKKFKPPISTHCLVFTENNYTYVARSQYPDDPTRWIVDCDGEQYDNASYEIFGITHFCIIEPVQRENAS